MQALDHDLRGYCHCIAGREVPGGLAQVAANTLKVCVGTGSIPLPEAGLELASIVHLVASHLAACVVSARAAVGQANGAVVSWKYQIAP